VKPAEEGIDKGIITRVWNLAPSSQNFSLSSPTQTIASAKQTTHIETDTADMQLNNNSVNGAATQQQLLTYRLLTSPSSVSPTTGPSPTPSITLGNGDTNNDGVVNIADVKLILQNWLALLTNSLDQFGDGRINAFDFARVVKLMPLPSVTPTSPQSASPTPTPTPAGNPTPTASSSTLQYVQSTLANTGNLVTSYPATFTTAVTNGNLLVIAISSWNSSNTAAVTSVTDNKGNSYTKVVENPTPVTGAVEPLSIWYAKNVTGGSDLTVTVNLQAAASLTIAVHEYAGVDKVNPVDVSQHQTGTGTTASSGTVSTAQATELLFGASNHLSDTTSATAGTGYTLRQSQDDNSCCEALYTEDRIVNSTGSYSATFTYATSVNYRAGIVAFKAAIP
jgi:hypothetical protein